MSALNAVKDMGGGYSDDGYKGCWGEDEGCPPKEEHSCPPKDDYGCPPKDDYDCTPKEQHGCPEPQPHCPPAYCEGPLLHADLSVNIF